MSANENQIVVYHPNETIRLDVRLENETVWLTQARLGVLFGVDRTVVNRHIHNIYKTGELAETATCAKIAQVQNEGGHLITRVMPFYKLDNWATAEVLDLFAKKRKGEGKCCQCGNVASCQFQFPMSEVAG